MEIKKQGAQSLRTKMRNIELYLKGATVIYGLQPLADACSKIAWTSVKVGKTRLLPLALLRVQERILEQALNRRVSDDTKLSRFTSLRWPEIAIVSKRTFYNARKCCLNIFYINKASHRKQRQLDWCFLSLFYFLSIISAFVTNMSFIKGWDF